LPDGSCGRPEGWAAHLSPGKPGCALLLGLAPGRVCPVSLRRPLARLAGIVTVALVLASRRTGVTRYPALRSSDFPHAVLGRPRRGARPSDRLADHRILLHPAAATERTFDPYPARLVRIHRSTAAPIGARAIRHRKNHQFQTRNPARPIHATARIQAPAPDAVPLSMAVISRMASPRCARLDTRMTPHSRRRRARLPQRRGASRGQ
jgi:hypothetical protein